MIFLLSFAYKIDWKPKQKAETDRRRGTVGMCRLSNKPSTRAVHTSSSSQEPGLEEQVVHGEFDVPVGYHHRHVHRCHHRVHHRHTRAVLVVHAAHCRRAVHLHRY